jgi:hypothetical protein
MKKAIILIVMILLFGCSYLNPIKYTYKTSWRYPILTKSEIRENPNVGVAILSKDGSHNTYYVERGIYDYVNYKAGNKLVVEIRFDDIGSEIELNENRNIANADTILKKYPQVRYVLYIWKDPPDVARWQSDRSTTRTSDDKKVVRYTEYKTDISIGTETVLFDLVGNEVLARAKKTFAHSASFIYEDTEYKVWGDVFINLEGLLWFLNPFSTLSDRSRDRYPPVTGDEIDGQFENYVYYFLEKINEQ